MDYDAIIVGARIAGASLAALLGMRGWRILLLDKATFPSDTLSTHFFRAPALRVFAQIGVLDKVAAAAPPMKVLWNYIDGNVISDPVQTDDERFNYFLCVRRITLDAILIERVTREISIELRQSAHVNDLIKREGRVAGVRWTEAGKQREATSRVVIGADGFYSKVVNAVQPEIETQYPVQRCMYYTYSRGIEPLDGPAAEHHFVGDSLTYVFPTDNDLTLVALSLPISEFSEIKKEPQKKLLAHLHSLPKLLPRLNRAEVVTEVKGAGNIPGYQRFPYGPGWVLVGDAQQVMDPWSGMGIDHATTHAGFLADALNRWLKEESDWQTAMTTYHQQARAWSEKSYRRTCTYAADLRPMTKAALQKKGLV